MDNNYARAYTEVLEILKYFPEEEFNKIPKEKIKYYEDNMDTSYEFSIDPDDDLEDQDISPEANAILVSIFQDYFASEEQKEKLNKILDYNEREAERIKREKYNPENIFKKEETLVEEKTEETALVESKDNFFVRFKKFILNLFHKNN